MKGEVGRFVASKEARERKQKSVEFILNTLAGGHEVKGVDMAAAVGCSDRTIYRYMREVMNDHPEIVSTTGYGYMKVKGAVRFNAHTPPDVLEIAQEAAFEWYGGRHPSVLAVRNMTIRIANAIMRDRAQREGQSDEHA